MINLTKLKIEMCSTCPAMNSSFLIKLYGGKKTEAEIMSQTKEILAKKGCPSEFPLKECPSSYAREILAEIGSRDLCKDCYYTINNRTCFVRPQDKECGEAGNVFRCVLNEISKSAPVTQLMSKLKDGLVVSGEGAKSISDIVDELLLKDKKVEDHGHENCEACPAKEFCPIKDLEASRGPEPEYVAPEFDAGTDYAKLKAIFTEFAVPFTEDLSHENLHVICIEVIDKNPKTVGLVGLCTYYLFNADGSFKAVGINE